MDSWLAYLIAFSGHRRSRTTADANADDADDAVVGAMTMQALVNEPHPPPRKRKKPIKNWNNLFVNRNNKDLQQQRHNQKKQEWVRIVINDDNDNDKQQRVLPPFLQPK